MATKAFKKLPARAKRAAFAAMEKKTSFSDILKNPRGKSLIQALEHGTSDVDISGGLKKSLRQEFGYRWNTGIRYRLDLLKVREPKMLLAGNPAHNWVKFRFIRDEEGNEVNLPKYRAFVPALLSDNPDPEFRRIYGKQLSQLSHYDRRRLLEGDWDAVAREAGKTADVPF